MKKIRMKTKDLNMNIDTHNEMVVAIDDVIFICSEECNSVDIMLGERDQGADHIDTIDNEATSRIVDLEDLKTFAVNWFFENVEVVKEFPKNPVVIDENGYFVPENDFNQIQKSTTNING